MRPGHLLSLTAVLAAACFRPSGEDVRTSFPSSAVTPRSTDAGASNVVSVVLAEDVGTDVDEPGDRFTAHLGDRVTGAAGEIVAERGARIDGVVCVAREGRDAALALDVTRVETTSGWREVHGRLVGARELALPVAGEVYDPLRAPFDVFLSPRYIPGPLAVYGSPAGIVYPSPSPSGSDGASRIHVPVGTRLEVALDAPLESAPAFDPETTPCEARVP